MQGCGQVPWRRRDEARLVAQVGSDGRGVRCGAALIIESPSHIGQATEQVSESPQSFDSLTSQARGTK